MSTIEPVTLSDGATLATWTDGVQRDLPPVVLLRGGPGLWDDLGALADLLAGATLVHRFYQRGCGRSPESRIADQHQSGDDESSADITVEQLLADLEELRLHWGHARWVVIGHSFGADLALAAAAAQPDHVAAVGYLSGTGVGGRHTPYRAERDRLFPEDPAVTDAALIAAAVACTVPAWFVHGSGDPRPVASVVELAARAQRARKRAIEGAGHRPWVEQHARTRDVLLEVLHSAR